MGSFFEVLRGRKVFLVTAIFVVVAYPFFQFSSISYSATQTVQLRVIISGGFSAAYAQLLPEFERTTGISVATSRGGSIGDSPRAIPNQIRSGVPADVVILARQGLRELIDEGFILENSDTNLAHSVIGMVVAAGTTHPDISNPDSLRETLLNASSISVSGSTSGRYLTTELFPRLGVADQIAPKTITRGGAAVGRGEAEIGFQQISELLPIEGADFVGAIPDELQFTTTYAAAILVNSVEASAAHRLIDYFASQDSVNVIANTGMIPARDE